MWITLILKFLLNYELHSFHIICFTINRYIRTSLHYQALSKKFLLSIYIYCFYTCYWNTQFSSVIQSCLNLYTPWNAAHQAFLSFTISRSLFKLMSIKLVMPSNRLCLCLPILLQLSIFPSIRVFSSELALHIRWPK